MQRKIFLVLAGVVAFFSPLAHTASTPQTLTLHGRDEPTTFDPPLVNGIAEGNITMNLFEGLVRNDPKTLEPTPGLAKSWTISPDGKTYTFTLRPGLKWSDGSPLTARDFVYSWERALRPATASPEAALFYYIKNGEAYNTGKMSDPKLLGLKALNDQTFQVTLEHATPYFIPITSHTSYVPVKKDIVEKFGDQWSRPDHIVSSGAFTLTSWIPQKEIVLVKNPNYWDAKNVKLETVRYLPVADYDTALKMYDAGQLDAIFELPPIKVRDLRTRPDFLGGPYFANTYFSFNTTVTPFDDPRVRRALAIAIDRQVLTDKVLQRGDVPMGTFVPHGIPGYAPPAGQTYDPERARALLKEAGFGPGGKPFPTIELLSDSKEEHRMVAAAIQNMWHTNLGINATLRFEEWKVYLSSLKAHNFQIAREGWVGDYLDPTTFLDLFHTNSPNNYGKYSNPRYDSSLREAEAEQNKIRRSQLLQQAENQLLQDAAIVPLYVVAKNFLLKPYVRGYYPTLLDWHPLYRAAVER